MPIAILVQRTFILTSITNNYLQHEAINVKSVVLIGFFRILGDFHKNATTKNKAQLISSDECIIIH